jgi:acyl-coenzyme A thioesterase PaaI-like protein
MIRAMAELLELPHTTGCLVCGIGNAKGLKLSLFIDPATGTVHVDFSPKPEHIGFQGIAHGGMLGTVLDEAMVWAATWNLRRFCYCGEMSVRFRRPATVGEKLHLEARVELSRPKIVQAAATIRTPDQGIVAAASGKYVPMSPLDHERVIASIVDDASTRAAANMLKRAAT